MKQHLVGEIIGIAAGGEIVRFWQMYTFYNPVTVWTNSDGEDIQLKDWVRITGPNNFDNVTYFMNDAGAWEVQENSERQYERVLER